MGSKSWERGKRKTDNYIIFHREVGTGGGGGVREKNGASRDNVGGGEEVRGGS